MPTPHLPLVRAMLLLSLRASSGRVCILSLGGKRASVSTFLRPDCPSLVLTAFVCDAALRRRSVCGSALAPCARGR
eukprot:6202191-Pleurochrysis_carterae.AAC.2